MNLKLISFCLLFLLSLHVFSQDKIPNFNGTDLNDHQLSFPKESHGKKSLIGFAFSRKAQEDLETWVQPVYDEFIDKQSLAALVYDANVYLIIAFNKFNENLRKKAIKEMKENILEEFYPNIVLSDLLAGELKKALDITNDDEVALFALDENGEITGEFSGRYSDKKMEKLANLLEAE